MSEKKIDVLRDEFMQKIIEDWHSPDTMDHNYALPPKAHGVYALILTKNLGRRDKISQELIYIGASKNLFNRRRRHEVIENISQSYPSALIQFYFKETGNCWEEEKDLILIYHPLMNRVRKFK